MAWSDSASTASTMFTKGFIDKRAATFHGAFGVESHFNTAMAKYETKETHDLEDTLVQFQLRYPNHADFGFDLLNCKWHDVLNELERAQGAVIESENRGKKLPRKLWRGLGEVSSIIAPGLAALPDDLCVLNGGLAVIFSLARHRAQDRQKILVVFEDIPSIIMMAYGKAGSIPRDQQGSDRLLGLIGDLQQTLLGILPVLIDRLNPGTFMNKLKSPFRGFDLDDLFSKIRSSAERVRVCAEDIMDNIHVETNELSKNIHSITQQTEGGVGELHKKIEEILKQQKTLQASLEAVSSKNSLLSFLTEYLKPEPRQLENLPPESPELVSGRVTEATPVTPRQLLDLMDVHHLRALDDEQHIIRRGNSLNAESISHAATMFQTPQVHRLLHGPGSGVVLVNLCSDRSQNGKISPITNVCATLTQAIRSSSEANVVLSFFCGQHSTSSSDLLGPQGLMRSLVAFLILSLVQHDCISDFTPIYFKAFQGDFERLSFRDTCDLFAHLIGLVPKEITVYCIVDGISFYERDIWREDYDAMMQCFGAIIENRDVATTFKLLMTSPTMSRWLPDLMPDSQRVSLRNLRTTGTGRRGDFS